MIGGQGAQHFSHSGGHPAVATAPEERHVGRVIEEAVRLLQLVEIGRHLQRITIEILPVPGCAVRLQLQDREHIHVVDPEAGLVRQAVGLRIIPLLVGPLLTIREIFLLVRLKANLQRNGAEDVVIDVMPRRDVRFFSATGHDGIKLLDQLLGQIGVVRELSKRQRAVPRADFGVVNRRCVLVRAGHEVIGKALSQLPVVSGRQASC